MASKNIAIFCDGTWQHLDQRHPTNVNRLARCVLPFDDNATPQVVRYDDGVGVATGILDHATAFIGGVFGEGLENKVMRAYEFLCLNYNPDDEIFIFGFSRGAYTARSLAGLLDLVWILRRDHADRITDVRDFHHDPVRRERSAGLARKDAIRQFRSEHCHPTGHIQYVGVWDTVGALGIPKGVLMSRQVNAKFDFLNTDLSPIVRSARHAVAIDERRGAYEPALWQNIEAMNGGSSAQDARPEQRPYQQQWFPGRHSGVGGGEADRGLSLSAMRWIAQGAINAGLRFDPDALAAYEAQENPDADFVAERPSVGAFFTKIAGGEDDRDGPTRLDEVSEAARLRWAATTSWRKTPTLAKVAAALDREVASWSVLREGARERDRDGAKPE